MLPPTPLTHRPRGDHRRTVRRVVSTLVALAVLGGVLPLTATPSAVAAEAPAAVSLSVVAGPTRGGTTVDVSGTGVGAATTVWFGTAAVTAITHVSSTRVRVVTPAHAAGLVDVRVTTPSGTSPVSTRSSFAFEAVPTLTGLSSRSATTAGGTSVVLTGTGLYRASAVRFGSTLASGLTRLSAQQLRVTVPAAPVAGAVDVRVTTPGGTSAVTSAARFTYTTPAPAPAPVTTPTVSALSVKAGPVRGGTVVTLTGQRFTGARSVSFGGTLATSFTVLSSTQLRVTAPPHAAGLVNVRVTTAAGTSSAWSANAYAYEAVPTIGSIRPASGGTGGGTVVTLTGTGLARATSVRFGTTTTTKVVRVSATTLRVTAPAHAAGTVDVRVTTPGGVSPVTSRARYLYAPPPSVGSLSVTAGPVLGGTVVTLTGARFSGATKVTFGSTAARFTVLSSTTLRVTSPAHAAGVVSVRVTTAYGTSAATPASTFAYDAVPTITALSPQTGPPRGGTVVTLTGTGLTRATSVRFGTTVTTNVVRVSATTLRVTTPAHASGPVDVRVTTPGGTSPVSPAARYAYGSPPTVTGLSVTAGPLRGGVVVTITGTHLADATHVSFGGVAATGLVRVSGSTLRATAPAHAAGTVAVRVTNPNGTSPENAAATFTYVGIPTVTGLSAPAGPLPGGTVLTLTGTNLSLASAVDVGGRPGTGLVRVSDTQLRFTTPAGVVGTVLVRVTTPGGVSGSAPGAMFTYQPVPTVASVSPTLAPTRGGGVVTVTGTGFDRVSAVTFGSTPATAVTRVSATELRVTLPAHAESVVDVRVTTPGGISLVVPAGRFTFQDPPVVASVTPSAGPLRGGTVVTIRGTSFTNVRGVWFNGVAATSVTRLSATQLTAVVPARIATGAVPMRITTPAGTVVKTAAFTYLAGATLQNGQVLSSGTALRSSTGAYFATMQADGNLVITSSAGVRRWASGTTGAGNRLYVRTDGNIVMLRTDGTVAWSSGTHGWTGALLTLTNDGLLQVRQGTTTVWDHRGIRYDRMLPGQVLRSGEQIMSANQAWFLKMGTDGNLVLSSAGGVRQWATFTTGAGSTATMQADGNFVVRNRSGVALWSTKTSGTGSVVRVLGNKNVAIYRATTVTWAITGGPAPTGWSCYSRATQYCIERFGYYGQRAWNYPVDAWGNNCTNFAAYRLARDGVRNPGNLGNAETWDNYARDKGFVVDQRPRVGDVAQWNSNHVAYVDWVSADGDTIAISESGYGGTVLGKTYTSMSGRRIIERGSYSWPSNFIHFR